MNLSQILELPVLRSARVVAGTTGLGREVRWLHVVDIPNPLDWLGRDHLLLTTGYAWPRDAEAERRLVRDLAAHGLAGVALAVPHFFERFSEESRAEADRMELPLIEIPWELPFARITEEAHRAILASQYEVMARSERVHRALTRAAVEAVSLQELADTLGRLVDREVLFVGADGTVLGACRATAAGDARPGHGRMPASPLGELERRGLLAELRSSTQPLRLPSLPELGLGPRVVCPIRPGGEYAGQVWIVEGDEPLSELDLRTAEHAATVAALHLTHQRQLESVEARLGHAFLDALLEGRFEGSPRDLERANLMGFDTGGEYRVGIMALPEEVPLTREGFMRREGAVARLKRHLEGLGVAPILSVSLNHIVFLIPSSTAPEGVAKGLDPGATTALGSCRRGVEGIGQSHADARATLRVALGPGLHRHEEHLVPRVLEGDAEARERFLEDLLSPIASARGGGKLLSTLLVWAETGFSQSEAAERLGIHANTLRYRLDRAAALADLDLSDAETRFRLGLAARLLVSDHKLSRSFSGFEPLRPPRPGH